MVDLRVRQQHAGDRRRADAVEVRRRERLELLPRVRRGVDEKPRPLDPADRQRRLRAGARALAGARGLTRCATAVPLRKSTSGGRAQNADAHGRRPFRRLPVEHVRRDFRAELDDLELRLDPRHSASFGWTILRLEMRIEVTAADPDADRGRSGRRGGAAGLGAGCPGPGSGGGRSGGDGLRAPARRWPSSRPAPTSRACGPPPRGGACLPRRDGRVGARSIAARCARGPGPRARRRRRHRRLRSARAARRRALRDLRLPRRPGARGRPRGVHRPLDQRRPRARRRASERDHPGRPRGAGRGRSAGCAPRSSTPPRPGLVR